MCPSSRPPLLKNISRSGNGGTDFPFSVPAIATLTSLPLTTPITFLAGGNGTGKSTLLEAVAAGTNRVPVAANRHAAHSPEAEALAADLRFAWLQPRPGVEKGFSKFGRRGFFLRAEDFLEYKRDVKAEVAELRRTAAGYSERLEGHGLTLARDSALGQANQMTRRYGEDLDAMSHGESFLQFFRARFTGPGLYLLDEPDTALSPQSVLGLMAGLSEMVDQGAQFIIASHHPMLLAYPGAAIFSFDRTPVGPATWQELEQVQLLKDFLDAPRAYLRHLGLDRAE
jgi:predicted ATPase